MNDQHLHTVCWWCAFNFKQFLKFRRVNRRKSTGARSTCCGGTLSFLHRFVWSLCGMCELCVARWPLPDLPDYCNLCWLIWLIRFKSTRPQSSRTRGAEMSQSVRGANKPFPPLFWPVGRRGSGLHHEAAAPSCALILAAILTITKARKVFFYRACRQSGDSEIDFKQLFAQTVCHKRKL